MKEKVPLPKNKVILIGGPPGAGKSTLAKFLSKQYSLPIVSKDEFKEMLFDELGSGNREHSKKLGQVSFELMYLTMKKLLRAKADFIVDAYFSHSEFARKRFYEFQQKFKLSILQINLYCDGDVLAKRFKTRFELGERHPGHGDHLNFGEFENVLKKGRREPINCQSSVVEIDTTDINSDWINEIEAQVDKFWKKPFK